VTIFHHAAYAGRVRREWKVETDRDRCIGSGTCAFTAADVFDVDDTGRAVVIGPVAAGDERVRDAVRACPTGALRLVGEDER
jgi:ferredoxin